MHWGFVLTALKTLESHMNLKAVPKMGGYESVVEISCDICH